MSPPPPSPLSGRPLAKRQKVVQLFDYLHLPLPIVGQVLQFLDVDSLVQLAACNSAWQTEVYEENPKLWKEIFYLHSRKLSGDDFENMVVDSKASKITDFQLASLLGRCKARERCQVLKVTGCIRLTGRGLEPLRGSFMLQEIDLRLCGSARGSLGGHEMDLDQVLPILDSMPPFVDLPGGLSMVKLDRNVVYGNYWDKYDPEAREWLEQLEQRLLEQSQKCRPCCDFCKGDIAELGGPENLHFKIPAGYCELCKKISCQEGEECPATNECEDCNLQCCQDWDLCPNCQPIETCGICDRNSCLNCADGFFCDGDDCGDWICGNVVCGGFCRECKNNCMDNEGNQLTFCSKCIVNHEKNCTFQSAN